MVYAYFSQTTQEHRAMNAGTGTAHVTLVTRSTVVGDKVLSVALMVNGQEVYNEQALENIDPVKTALAFMVGYMSECPTTPSHTLCDNRVPTPFTFSIENEWITQYS